MVEFDPIPFDLDVDMFNNRTREEIPYVVNLLALSTATIDGWATV